MKNTKNAHLQQHHAVSPVQRSGTVVRGETKGAARTRAPIFERRVVRAMSVEIGATTTTTRRDGGTRDAVWWTELEFRRLSNVVTEMVESKRYERDAVERGKLRKYLDGMRKKSLRVLHRAEQVGDGVWPGLDRTLTDPVSLAEEYVRVVERFEAQFVSASPSPPAAAQPQDEEWEARDAREYREAVARERARDAEVGRAALLQGATTLRQRRAPAALSTADEELMKRHSPLQEQLTAQLAEAVGKLKGSVGQVGDQLKRDDEVLDGADAALEKNLGGISKQRDELAQYERSSAMSIWAVLALFAIVLAVFVLVILI